MQASVLIVEYSTRPYLVECLDSLERSEFPRDAFEIIVVDNASSTPVDGLVDAYPRVRFVKSRRNLGFAGGNILALERARADNILLLNPDARAAPDWLGEMVLSLKARSVGVVGCKILHPGTHVLQHAGGMLFPNARSEHRGRGQDDVGQFDREADVEYVCGAAIGTRRDVIDTVGFLSAAYFPAYYEETELCVRARQGGYRVLYNPRAVVEHHESVASGGASTRKYLQRYHEGRMRFVYRNYSLRQIAFQFLPSEAAFLSARDGRERRVCARAYLSALMSSRDSSPGAPRAGDVIFDTGAR
ncbi:MAG TPA: glycosyltransferase family 2 protein [Polyangiaceae bacterium]|nr:glycosyltransferase family 2 protein [Polyangiaceae bacterium]